MNTEQMPARWYSVSKDGAATLCVDEADAIETASESQQTFPQWGPYRAVQMVPLTAAPQASAHSAAASMQAVCSYISDVFAGDASFGEKHIARTIMHLLPLAEAMAAPQAPADADVPQEWFHLLAEARNEAYDEEGYIMCPDLASAVEDVDTMLAAMSTKAGEKA